MRPAFQDLGGNLGSHNHRTWEMPVTVEDYIANFMQRMPLGESSMLHFTT
jgi:hypothetical protein